MFFKLLLLLYHLLIYSGVCSVEYKCNQLNFT